MQMETQIHEVAEISRHPRRLRLCRGPTMNALIEPMSMGH